MSKRYTKPITYSEKKKKSAVIYNRSNINVRHALVEEEEEVISNEKLLMRQEIDAKMSKMNFDACIDISDTEIQAFEDILMADDNGLDGFEDFVQADSASSSASDNRYGIQKSFDEGFEPNTAVPQPMDSKIDKELLERNANLRNPISNSSCETIDHTEAAANVNAIITVQVNEMNAEDQNKQIESVADAGNNGMVGGAQTERSEPFVGAENDEMVGVAQTERTESFTAGAEDHSIEEEKTKQVDETNAENKQIESVAGAGKGGMVDEAQPERTESFAAGAENHSIEEEKRKQVDEDAKYLLSTMHLHVPEKIECSFVSTSYT